MNDVLVPQATDSEQGVIGGLLIDNNAIDRLGDLRVEHFYRADHRVMYGEILAMIGQGVGADVITLADRIRAKGADAGGLEYLSDIVANTPSAANIAQYATTVRDRAQQRGLLELAHDTIDAVRASGAIGAAALIDQAQAGLEKLAEGATRQPEPVRAGDDLINFVEYLELHADDETAGVMSTGYPDLDAKLAGGIRGGDLIVIAGRPKMGKTALALNIGLHVANGGNVLVLSMEMPKRQLHTRNVAILGGVPIPRLLQPKLMLQSDYEGLTAACKHIESLGLWLEDQGNLSLMDVRLKARQIKRKHGLNLLVIDYLQLMRGEGPNRNAEIEGITRGLKALAMELDIGIVLLSQLNRDLEKRPNKRPMPSDLRDSGAIEQDCDAILFVYRDEVYNADSPDRGVAEIIIGAGRQVDRGTVGLQYIGERTKFQSLAQGQAFGNRPAAKGVRYSLMDE
ncbi:replicative DNA helicase [Achromobacter spanius]|uniref:replicative DNA helicase n=1 Tax=Achromobacter spanius TaxID=217203 RepID=UPI000F8FBA61|nr:replicative DNA helicase [Achromobacter spanius]AZS78577.1 replicative DNA helicase [Achromobacter spanius]